MAFIKILFESIKKRKISAKQFERIDYMAPKITLDQWRALVAVVESGGYAQAAAALNRTQSTVSYAVHKIEELLGIQLFEIKGRKAVLTAAGEVLYRRAGLLLERAGSLERGARSLAAGWEPEIRVAIEIVFPTWVLLRAFERFANEHPEIRIQLFETVLGGTYEALVDRRVDFAITASVPPGLAGTPIMPIRLIAAAHPSHSLHKLGRSLTLDDLRDHRQLVVRDSAIRLEPESRGWLGAEQRWTVSHKATQIAAACMGLGFAWFPEGSVSREVEAGQLARLPMAEGGERFGQLYLVFSEAESKGKAAGRLAEILLQDTAEFRSRLDL